MTYISTQINDLRKKSDWVDGLKYEIEKHNRRRLYSFFVFILSFLAYLNMDIINNNVEIPYIVKATLEINWLPPIPKASVLTFKISNAILG